MRHIKKRHEPEAFTQWKTANSAFPLVWEDLATDAKRGLRDALMAEQGHICCYCGTRIKSSDGKCVAKGEHEHETGIVVEHLKPRSVFPDLTFEYNNLLASCSGGQTDAPPRMLHCDKKKGDWYDEELMVSPLSPDCESHFIFRPDGAIEPTPDTAKRPAGEETIERLGLAVDKVVADRNAALDGALEQMFSKPESQWKDYIQSLCEPDQDGRLAPFCFALAQVLRRYL